MMLPGEACDTELECECGERFTLPLDFGRVDPAAEHRKTSGHRRMEVVKKESAA